MQRGGLPKADINPGDPEAGREPEARVLEGAVFGDGVRNVPNRVGRLNPDGNVQGARCPR
ncbi:MAG: hypothetical protein AAF531_16825 [Actinomycetota bacterium]